MSFAAPEEAPGSHAAGRVSPAGPRVLAHVMTVPCSLDFVAGQPRFMDAEVGLAVHAISAPGEELEAFGRREGVPVHGVRMERRITPLRDLLAVWDTWRVLRRIRAEVVHAHTPKGGLVGMLAGALAGVPVRIYQMHGLPMLTAGGMRRRLLRWAEWTSCRLAHRVLSVSGSVREIAVAEGLCPASKIGVLLDGSINGVDVDRFRPAIPGERAVARERLGLQGDDLVVGFVGRLARDKGIGDLARAWEQVRARVPRAALLLVGQVDPTDPPPAEALAALHADPRVWFAGQLEDSAPAYAAMDLVVLPTYREGFPTVALETASAGLPIVATKVSGCVDAVVDGVTGALVPPGDPAELARAVVGYLSDPAGARDAGAAARRRVLERFRRERVWGAIAAEYRRLLGDAPEPAGAELGAEPSPRRSGVAHG